METKRLPGIAASVVVTGMLLGATAAGLVMPIERWVTQLGGLLGEQGLLGVAVYGLLFVICALTFVPAAPLCFMAGFLWGPWGILLAWSCLMAAANTALPAARHLLRAPTGIYTERSTTAAHVQGGHRGGELARGSLAPPQRGCAFWPSKPDYRSYENSAAALFGRNSGGGGAQRYPLCGFGSIWPCGSRRSSVPSCDDTGVKHLRRNPSDRHRRDEDAGPLNGRSKSRLAAIVWRVVSFGRKTALKVTVVITRHGGCVRGVQNPIGAVLHETWKRSEQPDVLERLNLRNVTCGD